MRRKARKTRGAGLEEGERKSLQKECPRSPKRACAECLVNGADCSCAGCLWQFCPECVAVCQGCGTQYHLPHCMLQHQCPGRLERDDARERGKDSTCDARTPPDSVPTERAAVLEGVRYRMHLLRQRRCAHLERWQLTRPRALPWTLKRDRKHRKREEKRREKAMFQKAHGARFCFSALLCGGPKLGVFGRQLLLFFSLGLSLCGLFEEFGVPCSSEST